MTNFKEKYFQSLFTKYAKKNELPTGLYELKLARGGRFYFSQIEEHQWAFLLKAKHRTLVHKISDASFGFKPADTVIFTKSKAYVVVMFYKLRQKKQAYVIDIDVVREAKTRQKSLVEAEAKELAEIICLL